MKRRTLLRVTAGFIAGAIGLGTGCAVSRIGDKARDLEAGDPWRCQTCGYLTRSTEDISHERCPRCMTKKLRRITEEEFADWLEA